MQNPEKTVYTYLYSLESTVLNHHIIRFQKVVREKEKKQHILSFLAHSTSLLVRICVSCFSIGFNIYLLSEFHGVSKKGEAFRTFGAACLLSKKFNNCLYLFTTGCS